ncbi:MAG: DNA mismatch repair endonuclease MutL [Eubacteriales bacterium]
MSKIQILDQITIDKIAAGEVIERPAAVVKELVENAIDAGATSVVIEIKEGGIAFIRITDNGNGFEKDDIPCAFLRHATSKIRTIDDLSFIDSLGFRGEALSSIASVAQVELLTKQEDESVGSSYSIHGGIEQSFQDAAVNNGTTFLVRQLFYNIPARRKFLKTASTEASHISELVTRLALSHPKIAFQFINNGTLKLHTSGNGILKDIIYHIYGRDIANNLIPVDYTSDNIKISGFIGKPDISRGNRNYENYFINGRYVKSSTISKAIEDGYKGYSMQHRYPFTVLHIEMDTTVIDVNVHPTKMELRFTEQNLVYNEIYQVIQKTLSTKKMISEITLDEKTTAIYQNNLSTVSIPQLQPLKESAIYAPSDDTNKLNIASNSIQPEKKIAYDIEKKEENSTREVDNNNIICKPHKNTNRYGSSLTAKEENENLDYFMSKMQDRVNSYHHRMSSAEVESTSSVFKKDSPVIQDKIAKAIEYAKSSNEESVSQQLNMFEEHMLEIKVEQEYRLIGQVFSTYWMIEYKEQLYIIDQHAAHEKVLYERTIKNWKNKSFDTQYISPPIVLTLSMQEKELLELNIDKFTEIGFELETFGSDAYAIRGIPANLFSIAKKELFIDMLDELSATTMQHLPTERIIEKIASMSCKAAVKGNSNISASEMEQLITDLLGLENPFHCPHGRPTIIAISKKEMEKKFKRIL